MGQNRINACDFFFDPTPHAQLLFREGSSPIIAPAHHLTVPGLGNPLFLGFMLRAQSLF